MFENRVLWKMFRPKGAEITGRERKLHQELHNLYSLSKQANMEDPDVSGNITKRLKEITHDEVDWINLAQNRVKQRVVLNIIKCRKFLD